MSCVEVPKRGAGFAAAITRHWSAAADLRGQAIIAREAGDHPTAQRRVTLAEQHEAAARLLQGVLNGTAC